MNEMRRAHPTHLGPMLTEMRLSRLSLHHCSTSVVKVALKRARRTFGEVQARKMVASCSLKPVLPSSNSLSDSSTTSHSTLSMHRHRAQEILQQHNTNYGVVFTVESCKCTPEVNRPAQINSWRVLIQQVDQPVWRRHQDVWERSFSETQHTCSY